MGQIDSRAKRMPPDVAVTEGEPSGAVLSAREDEIIAWVAEGRTNAEISRILAISPFTVKNHVQRIIKKLDASNRTEAAVRYLQGDFQQLRRKRTVRDAAVPAESADSST